MSDNNVGTIAPCPAVANAACGKSVRLDFRRLEISIRGSTLNASRGSHLPSKDANIPSSSPSIADASS